MVRQEGRVVHTVSGGGVYWDAGVRGAGVRRRGVVAEHQGLGGVAGALGGGRVVWA